MRDSAEKLPRLNRTGLFAALFAAAALLGAALAGWLNHGVDIFVSTAAAAWAMCF